MIGFISITTLNALFVFVVLRTTRSNEEFWGRGVVYDAAQSIFISLIASLTFIVLALP